MDALLKRSITLILFGLFSILTGCSTQPHLELTKTTYDELPAWNRDNHSQSLRAFQRSCREIIKRNPYSNFSKLTGSGKVGHWQQACYAASHIAENNNPAAQAFFEAWFEPYQISNNAETNGLFTGYYLPLLHGSLTANRYYAIPIYGIPMDFAANKKYYHSAYPDRASINNGAIHYKTPVLAWTHDPIELFFAQIQGSAIVELTNHQRFIISYAANNGHRYTAIGKILRDEYGIPKEQISMQTIKYWLRQHPAKINTILNRNASYVFFKVLHNDDPLGAERIPLLPERSLAVDLHYIPLGAPLWLNTTAPNMQRLMIAQDTGGAIKGVVRGDVYWGTGDKAEYYAGHMQSPGQYWILLPRGISS